LHEQICASNSDQIGILVSFGQSASKAARTSEHENDEKVFGWCNEIVQNMHPELCEYVRKHALSERSEGEQEQEQERRREEKGKKAR
jgi:hypothetical protein